METIVFLTSLLDSGFPAAGFKSVLRNLIFCRFEEKPQYFQILGLQLNTSIVTYYLPANPIHL